MDLVLGAVPANLAVSKNVCVAKKKNHHPSETEWKD